MHIKRGKKDPWVKGEPKGGVAVSFSWDSIIDALAASGSMPIHQGEVVNRLNINTDAGVTFYFDKETG